MLLLGAGAGVGFDGCTGVGCTIEIVLDPEITPISLPLASDVPSVVVAVTTVEPELPTFTDIVAVLFSIHKLVFPLPFETLTFTLPVKLPPTFKLTVPPGDALPSPVIFTDAANIFAEKAKHIIKTKAKLILIIFFFIFNLSYWEISPVPIM